MFPKAAEADPEAAAEMASRFSPAGPEADAINCPAPPPHEGGDSYIRDTSVRMQRFLLFCY